MEVSIYMEYDLASWTENFGKDPSSLPINIAKKWVELTA